jgi:HSP20 family protein
MLPARRYGQFGLNDFFNDFFENRALEKAGGNVPAINVVETDKEYKLELAAPGMTKDDFKIHLNKDGNLVVELEKKECGCKEKKECKFLRKEFSYARFTQTLLLPDNADKENIQARVENGILFVDVPKLQRAKNEEETKMIEIK